jgi:anti-sigma B factor antagonist
MEQSDGLQVGSSQVIVVLASDPTRDTVVWLRGEHDLSTVEAFTLAITEAVDSGGSDLVIDLSGVEFMDSTTIEQILAARTRLGAEGRKARVRHPSRPARYLLNICDLAHLVER